MLQGFTNSALGRRLHGLKVRNKILGKLSQKWDKEREAIKNVDWQETELFEVFQMAQKTKTAIAKLIQDNAKFNAKHKKEGEADVNADPDAVAGSYNDSCMKSKRSKRDGAPNDTQRSIAEDQLKQKELTNQPRNIYTNLELDYYIGLIEKKAEK